MFHLYFEFVLSVLKFKIVLLDKEEVIRMLKNDEFHQAMMAAPLWKYFAMNGQRSKDKGQKSSTLDFCL